MQALLPQVAMARAWCDPGGSMNLAKRSGLLQRETRPYMQGARLTVWELIQEGIAVELIPDNNHVGLLSANKGFSKVIVGADRIALNGDTANKIGTSMIALCAHRYRIPFYVAAPVSTFDRHIGNGVYIPIEERRERGQIPQGKLLTVKDVKARYYSFDVTPAGYITGFITEKGIVERPFKKYIKMIFS